VVGERDGQHPAKRPEDAPGLRCGFQQGGGLRIGQQGLNLSSIFGGSRHLPQQPAAAVRQPGSSLVPRPGRRPARPGWRQCSGLDSAYQGRQPRGQPMQPGKNADQQWPGGTVDRDA
jgi:hypothetical protein